MCEQRPQDQLVGPGQSACVKNRFVPLTEFGADWGVAHCFTVFRMRSPAPGSVGQPARTHACSSMGQNRLDLPTLYDGIAPLCDSLASTRLHMHSVTCAAFASISNGAAPGMLGKLAMGHSLALGALGFGARPLGRNAEEAGCFPAIDQHRTDSQSIGVGVATSMGVSHREIPCSRVLRARPEPRSARI